MLPLNLTQLRVLLFLPLVFAIGCSSGTNDEFDLGDNPFGASTQNQPLQEVIAQTFVLQNMEALLVASRVAPEMTNPPYTVFTPWDSAFEKLPYWMKITRNPAWRGHMRDLTLGLIHEGKLSPDQIEGNKAVTMLSGDTATVAKAGGRIRVDGISVIADTAARDGHLYMLDGVPEPEWTKRTILDIVKSDQRFSILAQILNHPSMSVKRQELASTSAELTFFAPTNDALAGFDIGQCTDAECLAKLDLLVGTHLVGAVIPKMFTPTKTMNSQAGSKLEWKADKKSITCTNEDNATKQMELGGIEEEFALNGIVSPVNSLFCIEVRDCAAECAPDQCGTIVDGCGNTVICDEGCENNNIAFQRMTDQSSTSFGGVSSRAVDGNTGRKHSDNTFAMTKKEADPWWRVDFKSPNTVTGVKIWTYSGLEKPLNDFHVDCLDENGTTIASKTFSGTAGETIELSIRAQGVYSLKVQLPPTPYETKRLALTEVKVWGFSETVCTPQTCEDVGAMCGEISDGCGNTVDCGGCEDGYACCEDGWGCEKNQCEMVCPVQSCADVGASCGYVYDNCKATLYCGHCSEGSICNQNECVQCTPKTCSEISPRPCGYVDDGCGNMIDCGECETATFLVPMSLGTDASWEELAFLSTVPASMTSNDGRPSVLAIQKGEPLSEFHADYLRRYKPGSVYTVGAQGVYEGDIRLNASTLDEYTCELAQFWGTSDTAVMSNSRDYHKSLSASGLAGRLRAPLFFFNGNSFPSSTLACLLELGVKKVITVGASSSVVSALRGKNFSVDSLANEYTVISWLETQGYGVDYFAVCNSYDRSHFFAPKSSLAAPILAATRNGAVAPLSMASEFNTPCELTLTNQKPAGAANGVPYQGKLEWKTGTCLVNGQSYNVVLSRNIPDNEHFGIANIDFNGDGDYSGEGELVTKGELRAFGDKVYLIDIEGRKHWADVRFTYPHSDVIKADIQRFHDALGHHPKFMAIVGLPDAIPPHLEIAKGYDLAGTPTDYVYADVDDDPMIDIAIGRIVGESASIATLSAARATTYEDLLDYSWKDKALCTGSFDTPREELKKQFENRGFKVDTLRSFFSIQDVEYSFIAHKDHGTETEIVEKISGSVVPTPISPAVVITTGCSMANISYLDNEGDDYTRFGAVRLAKMGAVGFIGISKNSGGSIKALRESQTYSSLLYNGSTTGEAFRDSLNAVMLFEEPGSHFVWRPALFGDPALKPYVPEAQSAIQPAKTVVEGDKVTAYAPEGHWVTYYWSGLCDPESKYGFDGPGLTQASPACAQPLNSRLQTRNELGRRYIAQFTVDRIVTDIVEQEGIEPGLGFNYTIAAPQYVVDEHWDGSSTVYMNLRFQIFNHQTGEMEKSYPKIEYYLQ